jgi:hypothetical protein
MAYSIKHIFTQEPTKVTAAVMAIVNALVISNALSWDEDTLGAVNIALGLVLSLFYTAPLVASKGKMAELDEMAAASRAEGEREALSQNFLRAEDVDAIVAEKVAAATASKPRTRTRKATG